MARYLPRDYVPLPDTMISTFADFIDVARRIARNQNWIWANHGNVMAATGHHPSGLQAMSVTASALLELAYFACPNRTTTGSDSVRVCGYLNVTGTLTTISGKIRLYQLLPGETTVTANTPFDETTITTSGTDIFYDFTARIRSGADPLRFGLWLVGAGTATYTILTATVSWARNPTSVLGETVAAWNALSQTYLATAGAFKAASAALLRAISNQTLKLVAENPRPIYCHSFVWPRIRTDVLVAETRVALYSLKADGLSSPKSYGSLGGIVTGQGASCTWRVYVNGTLYDTLTPTATTLIDGVWIRDFLPIGLVSSTIPSGDVKIEVTAQTTTAATAPPTYCTNYGCALLHFGFAQLARTATDLGLPGADTVPAAYQPIDEAAAVPSTRVLQQDDRLGRRAGFQYLVKNLIWLAANRTQHVLCADWLNRAQTAGWSVTNDPGDAYYRNTTVYSEEVSPGPNEVYERAPNSRDSIGWSDRAGPTNAYKINGATSNGHHRVGDVLGRFFCRPMNGGQIAAILRPDIVYQPHAPGFALDGDVEFWYDAVLDIRASARRESMVGGFVSAAPAGFRPSTGQRISVRGNSGAGAASPANPLSAYLIGRVSGMQICLHSLYAYEAPLTQTELDALA